MRALPLVLTVLLLGLWPSVALAQPDSTISQVPSEPDLSWTASMTADERNELLGRPRFAAGEPLLVGGLVGAGAGIAMLVAGLATKTPELTTAGAIVWPIGATVHFVGLGLVLSETRPFYRDLSATPAPGLSP